MEITPPSVERPQSASTHGVRRFRALLEEYARRQADAAKRYVPHAPAEEFHRCKATFRIISGSNQAGKTLAAVIECVWRLRNIHPFAPKRTRPLKAVAVGYKEEHIADPMWSKMAHPGAYWMIRDETTKQWRPAYPDQPYDEAYREKWVESPPLLPECEIKHIAWGKKNKDIPSIVTLRNGSTLRFESSMGKPRQGDQNDYVWIDEEMENQRWPYELSRGLARRGGILVYSATPLAVSDWLARMHRKANHPENDGKFVREFRLLAKDNIFLSVAEREQLRQSFLLKPGEMSVRWEGNYSLDKGMVYPDFSSEAHVVDSFDPPADWNRWMIVDPGFQTCAVLFGAVPPHELANGDQNPAFHERHIYDELYMHQCTAEKFAEAVEDKMGKYAQSFVGFIIDDHGSRARWAGSGRTIRQEYSDALKKRGIKSYLTSHDFEKGDDDVDGRTEAVRRWMLPANHNGVPVLRIHKRCGMLQWEITEQFYKKNPDGTMSDKREGRDDHAVDALEYWAAFDPVWIEPPRPKAPEGRTEQLLRLKRERQAEREQSEGGVSLGPPARA